MQIAYSARAEKQLKKIADKERILKAINLLPHGDVKALVNFSSAYRLRVGNYRVLYDVVDGVILINAVVSRDKAYK